MFVPLDYVADGQHDVYCKKVDIPCSKKPPPGRRRSVILSLIENLFKNIYINSNCSNAKYTITDLELSCGASYRLGHKEELFDTTEEACYKNDKLAQLNTVNNVEKYW